MNLVAKDLAIPLAFDRQMLELTRLRLCAIDYGSVTDKDGTEEIFLHSSAIGFVPRMARLREDLRASEGVGDWIGNAYRFVRGLFGVASKRVRFVGESGKTERATRSVLVSCNTIADMGPGTHLRTRLDGGVLGLYASAHKGPLATLRLAITFASGAFARDTETDCGTCTRVTISTRGARTAVSNDGGSPGSRRRCGMKCGRPGYGCWRGPGRFLRVPGRDRSGASQESGPADADRALLGHPLRDRGPGAGRGSRAAGRGDRARSDRGERGFHDGGAGGSIGPRRRCCTGLRRRPARRSSRRRAITICRCTTLWSGLCARSRGIENGSGPSRSGRSWMSRCAVLSLNSGAAVGSVTELVARSAEQGTDQGSGPVLRGGGGCAVPCARGAPSVPCPRGACPGSDGSVVGMRCSRCSRGGGCTRC